MSAVYGLLAEFDQPDALVFATEQARIQGYRKMDAYSPFPIEALGAAIGFGDRVPLIALIGGATGGLMGYLMQWYANVVDYPINIGGRPYHSWPAFIPVTFEMTILFGALCAALGMLALNGLPRPHHPVFDGENFLRASKDRFFLCIEASDPRFERIATGAFLATLKPLRVSEVPADED